MATQLTPAAPQPEFPIVKLSNHKAQMDMVLRLREVDSKKNIRGFQEKLFLGLTNYDATGKTPSRYLKHALDGPVFRMLATIILAHQFPQAITEQWFGSDPISKVVTSPQSATTHFYQWKEFKGGPDREGRTISRLLMMAYNDTPGHKYPWTIELSEGPGRPNATGAVMPQGAATSRVQMQLSMVQMHHWSQLGLEALQALTTAQLWQSPLLMGPALSHPSTRPR